MSQQQNVNLAISVEERERLRLAQQEMSFGCSYGRCMGPGSFLLNPFCQSVGITGVATQCIMYGDGIPCDCDCMGSIVDCPQLFCPIYDQSQPFMNLGVYPVPM